MIWFTHVQIVFKYNLKLYTNHFPDFWKYDNWKKKHCTYIWITVRPPLILRHPSDSSFSNFSWEQNIIHIYYILYIFEVVCAPHSTLSPCRQTVWGFEEKHTAPFRYPFLIGSSTTISLLMSPRGVEGQTDKQINNADFIIRSDERFIQRPIQFKVLRPIQFRGGGHQAWERGILFGFLT